MAEDLLWVYVIIATAGAFTTLVTAVYYWLRLRLEHTRSTRTEEYYTKRLLVEQKRADDAEKYYNERVKFEAEKLSVERGKLAAYDKRIDIDEQVLNVEKQKLAARNGPVGKP